MVHGSSRDPAIEINRIIEVSLRFLESARCKYQTSNTKLGIHTGIVYGSVVGQHHPKYELFGRTVEELRMMVKHVKPMVVTMS